MVKLTIDSIKAAMLDPRRVRNISVIAHVDHGKTTLTDSLLQECGLLSQANTGTSLATDLGELEIAMGVTIKSTAVSMGYHQPSTGEDHVIHLIDSPGHADFSSEVTAALRSTDGALVVVDCIEGPRVQTDVVLRQALAERVRPVLFLNKLDRPFLELHQDLDKIYEELRCAIESVNVVLGTYRDPSLPEYELRPEAGNVAFGSGFQAWGFRLLDFARLYAARSKKPVSKWLERLWGDKFFNPETGKWSSRAGPGFVRGFIHFVLRPLKSVFELAEKVDESQSDAATFQESLSKLIAFSSKLGVSLAEDTELRGRKLARYVLNEWIPAGRCLMELVIDHLPSPVEAQRYRVETIYTGDMSDEVGTAMKSCDVDGPLMFYASKLIPDFGGRFIAFGRVFSGTAKVGTRVRVLLPGYTPPETSDDHDDSAGRHKTPSPDSNADERFAKIQALKLCQGKTFETVSEVAAGNVMAIAGLDRVLRKCGTITTSSVAFPFRMMKFSVAPVVRVAVEPQRPSDLPKFVEAVRRVAKTDQLLQVSVSESGEHILAGAGQLHMKCIMHDLETVYLANKVPLRIGDPIVQFKETLFGDSRTFAPNEGRALLAKSPNKLNRFFLHAQSMDSALVDALESPAVTDGFGGASNPAVVAALRKHAGFTSQGLRKIWVVGEPEAEANLLIDETTSVNYIQSIRDSAASVFSNYAHRGVLCGEPLRGVQMALVDAVIHSDAAHRGSGQVFPALMRGFGAAQLAADPALLEPIFRVDITVPQSQMGGVYNVLSRLRGTVVECTDNEGTPLVQLVCHLPVLESFQFSEILATETSGQAFPVTTFDHWRRVPGDLRDEGSSLSSIVSSVRERKGLPLAVPMVSELNDRL